MKLDLPSRFLATPFGMTMRPMIENMFRPQPGPDGRPADNVVGPMASDDLRAAVRDAQPGSHVPPDQLAQDLLQHVSNQAANVLPPPTTDGEQSAIISALLKKPLPLFDSIPNWAAIAQRLPAPAPARMVKLIDDAKAAKSFDLSDADLADLFGSSTSLTLVPIIDILRYSVAKKICPLEESRQHLLVKSALKSAQAESPMTRPVAIASTRLLSNLMRDQPSFMSIFFSDDSPFLSDFLANVLLHDEKTVQDAALTLANIVSHGLQTAYRSQTVWSEQSENTMIQMYSALHELLSKRIHLQDQASYEQLCGTLVLLVYQCPRWNDSLEAIASALETKAMIEQCGIAAKLPTGKLLMSLLPAAM